MRRLSQLALPLLLSGCSGLSITKTVGPEGLIIELPGGAGLDIPAGALDADVEIGAELITDLAASGWQGLPAFTVGDAQFAIGLTPHGLQFASPVTLTMPALDVLDGLVAVRAEDEFDPDWRGVGPLTRDGDLISLQIDGFSGYGLTVIPDGACPCFDASDVVAFFEEGRSRTGWRESVFSNGDGTFDLRAIFASPRVTLPSGRPAVSEVDLYVLMRPGTPAVCTARASDAETESGTTALAEAFFPGLEGQGARRWEQRVSPIEESGYLACKALMQAGARGELGVATRLVTVGLPEGAAPVLRELVGGASATLDELSVDGPILSVGAEYDFAIDEQPAGATCTITEGGAGVAGAAGTSLEVFIVCSAGGTASGEVCNGLDDDDNGEIDEVFDAGQDGATSCGPDGAFGTDDDDCADADATIYPGNIELYDAVDNDCDGEVDEELPQWGYEEGSELPPDAWEDIYPACGGAQQSPIDLLASSAVECALEPIAFEYAADTTIDATNTGHTIQWLMGADSRVTYYGRRYNVKQFHFHTPSEHRIDGQGFAMEMHVVHQREGSTGNNDLLVIGVLFMAGAANSGLDGIGWETLPATEDETLVDAGIAFDPLLLLNPATVLGGITARYAGSLTTPPCDETVQWIVATDPVEASLEQIEAFESLFPEHARATQPLGDRLIEAGFSGVLE